MIGFGGFINDFNRSIGYECSIFRCDVQNPDPNARPAKRCHMTTPNQAKFATSCSPLKFNRFLYDDSKTDNTV